MDDFGDWLLASGYTQGSIRNILKDVGCLGRWMSEEGVSVADLDSRVVGEFVSHLHAEGRRRSAGVRAFTPLLNYLRCQGALSDSTWPSTPTEVLLATYRAWLVDERGLSEQTILRYEGCARRFLHTRTLDGSDGVAGLTGSDVVAFLLLECSRVSVGAAKGRVGELRSLLRFLYLTGRTSTPLAVAVPPVAGWHDVGIPAGINAEDVQRLLDGCDRATSTGVRDYAILILLARLGLRSVEVARLELGDIDWRAGRLLVRGKGRRTDILPLPCDVGEALSAYLTDARPSTRCRQVFMACKAPMRGIRPDLVGDVTRRACHRAGLPEVGAHRLRHALATDLLAHGAALAEVSQVLRHRDLATTAIYAKVDLGRLRSITLPWPGATR